MTVLLFLRRVDCNDGVASYCETIIRGLVANGHRVVVISGPVTQLYGSATRHAAIGERVLDWLVFDDLGSARPSVSTVRSILTAIRAYDVDVISPQGFSLLPLSFLLAKLTRRSIIANYHPSMTGTSPGSVATRRSLKLRLAYRTIARFCPPDRFIAISKEIAHFYRGDCAIPPGRIVHIPHGIDLSFFRTPSGDERTRARRTYDLADDALVCILPGRLNFDKGHDVTIDAVRMLRASRPDLSVVCLFPGGGDQGEAIRAYAHRDDADVRTFRFLGFIEPGAFRAAYWAADIGLLPSRFEGFGQVIAEAMSCGCVPIRTPSGGWEDQIVDRVNGYVIPFNDAAALAGRIAALADPVERAAMRERALTFAAGHFDQAAMVAATAAAYDAVTIPHRTRAAC